MQKENILAILVITTMIFGCGTPLTPTPSPVQSPTPSPRASLTPLPTATQQPTVPPPTPTPPLNPDGPYFAYFQELDGIRRLIFMNPNGEGRKVIDLPEAINNSFAIVRPLNLDMQWISPDGQWLAFYTGSVGDYGGMSSQGPFDLTLNLMNLATGEQQVVTPLLSKDYPNNFVEAAGKLNDPDITAESLYDAFNFGITQAIAWSPDGQYLAFAGQMDGLSSDLYVYEVETGAIRRLSSGDQELQWIDWSPDGKWILHSGTYFAGLGMTFDVYAATVDGSSAPHISTNNALYSGIKDWLNAHQYFEHDGENVVGEYGLRLVDVDTGGITKIWDETFVSYAVDKSGRWVAILDSPDVSSSDSGFDFETDFVPGIYLINLTTLAQSRVEFPDQGPIESFGLEGRDFVITTQNPVFLSIDGSLTQTDLGDAKLSVSPDSEYWLAVTDQGVKIFSADDTLIKDISFSLPIGFINDIVWRPDSSGAFLISATEIFAISIPDQEIKLVETNLSENYAPDGLRYMWVNGQ